MLGRWRQEDCMYDTSLGKVSATLSQKNKQNKTKNPRAGVMAQVVVLSLRPLF
jgi:hypothetical protein